MECVLGFEPNPHQISCFLAKYSYYTDHSEILESPISLNVLPMSQCCWGVGFFVSMNLSVSQRNWRDSGIEMDILRTYLSQDGVAGFSR